MGWQSVLLPLLCASAQIKLLSVSLILLFHLCATVDSILQQLRDVPDSVTLETCQSVIRKLDYFLLNLNFLYC